MTTIWFGFEGDRWSDALSVDVTGLPRAREAWDRLAAGGWHMFSQRP